MNAAQKMNDDARNKFYTNNNDPNKHPDLGGAPLSNAQIREARDRVLNGQPLDPGAQAKLNAIRAADQRAAQAQKDAANKQVVQQGIDAKALLETANSNLNVDRP